MTNKRKLYQLVENNNTRCQENKALCEKMMTFFFGVLLSIAGEEGGTMVKALARHVAPGWYPGVDAGVCCWFSPGLALKVFPGYSYMYFPLSSTTNISKFQFDQEWYTKNHYVHVVHLTCYFFISSFFFLF